MVWRIVGEGRKIRGDEGRGGGGASDGMRESGLNLIRIRSKGEEGLKLDTKRSTRNWYELLRNPNSLTKHQTNRLSLLFYRIQIWIL